MKILMRRMLVMSVIALCVRVPLPYAQSQSHARPGMASDADFRRAMKDLSNWGRWGADDELGAANLITPAKRKQALALATEGVPVSVEHARRLNRYQFLCTAAPLRIEKGTGSPLNPLAIF